MALAQTCSLAAAKNAGGCEARTTGAAATAASRRPEKTVMRGDARRGCLVVGGMGAVVGVVGGMKAVVEGT